MKLNLMAGTWIDNQTVNPGFNVASYFDSDGSKLRKVLEESGYEVKRNYDTGRNGIVILSNGYTVSTNGYVGRLEPAQYRIEVKA